MGRGGIWPDPHGGAPIIERSRSAIARERAAVARAALANCHLCAHHCGVNRLAGERGLCHAGAETRVFIAQTEVSDELELIPTFAIALSGCDLRCAFCITGKESWNPRAGEPLDAARIAKRAEVALAAGARTIMLLGGEPTIHLPAALEIVAALPDDAKLIWKTNAHGSAQARALLDGLFDVWLADYKFGNDACAARLARIPDYTRVVQENLLWMSGRSVAADVRRLCGNSINRNPKSENGGASSRRLLQRQRGSELIVRHLVMPGHVECCWRPVAKWLATHLPGVKVNLRTAFWSAWQALRYSELRRTVSNLERQQAAEIARSLDLNLVE
ncbi:MAG: radical SAM protein [Verrucomicrobia bacterium]|nr:radical SAM protein [Verrucomicrobiota bacterium]